MSVIITYLFAVLGISLSVFGGGPVFIPIFEGLFKFIGIYKINFEELTAIVNATPGPLGAKYAVIGGYLIEGGNIWVGLAALLIFILSAYLLVLVAQNFVRVMSQRKWFSKALNGSAPAVAAILLVIGLGFIGINFRNPEVNLNLLFQIIIFAIALVIMTRWKVEPFFLVVFVMIIGVITFNMGIRFNF